MFINWIRGEYHGLVVPLGHLAFHPQYLNAIYLKVTLIVKYCEDDELLASSRDSLDHVRAEMRPGLVDPAKDDKKVEVVAGAVSPRQYPGLVSVMEGLLHRTKSVASH